MRCVCIAHTTQVNTTTQLNPVHKTHGTQQNSWNSTQFSAFFKGSIPLPTSLDVLVIIFVIVNETQQGSQGMQEIHHDLYLHHLFYSQTLALFVIIT